MHRTSLNGVGKKKEKEKRPKRKKIDGENKTKIQCVECEDFYAMAAERKHGVPAEVMCQHEGGIGRRTSGWEKRERERERGGHRVQ